MPSNRKLDRPTDQRIAILKNLVTGLIMTGKLETTEARGKEVKIGGELYSDSLGDKEHNTETYIKTVKANADIITDALK